jgi:hypothetical protein
MVAVLRVKYPEGTGVVSFVELSNESREWWKGEVEV